MIDLVNYGLIHEFIGRVPVVAALNNLSVKDLVRILHEPKNSLVKQYQGLFELNKVYININKRCYNFPHFFFFWQPRTLWRYKRKKLTLFLFDNRLIFTLVMKH